MDIKESFKPYLGKTNSPEAEQVFRETCSLYEKQCSTFNQSLIQDYQEYLNHYHQITSLYLTIQEGYKTMLIIYDTESEIEKEIILDVWEPLNAGTCITQLPNGDLFCFSNSYYSGVSLIIDKSYRVRILPYGAPCCSSSCIYFNNNVYIFGGWYRDCNDLTLSSRFNLIENRWINLTSMPWKDYHCSNVIFNGNILISGYEKSDLLLYSIDIDSFSKIPQKFGKHLRKILINIEKLYLIEWGLVEGLIYESEDGYNWKQISKFIRSRSSYQVYYTYNKGGIYISIQGSWGCNYYKFDLSKKMIDVLYM